MNRSHRLFLTIPLWLWLSTAPAATPFIRVETNQGGFTLQLDPDKAPVTVANFLRYLDEGFYLNTLFHRSIPGFVVQGGGFDKDSLAAKPVHEPIVNEAANGLSNVRGSVAMARTAEPDSATAQFYINTGDNGATLDQGAPPPNTAGYAVFGKVVEGMATIDAINALPVAKNLYSNVPQVYWDLPIVATEPFTLVFVKAMYRLLPLADAGADFSVRSGQVASLNGSASSDPTPGAGGTLIYQWTQIGDGPRVQFNAGAEGPNPSFTAPEVQTDTELRFRLTVTNGYGNQSVNDAVVQVLIRSSHNAAPIAKAGIGGTVKVGAVLTLEGGESTDPDGDTLSFEWTAPPGIEISNPQIASPTLVIPHWAGGQTLTFQLTVSDGRLSSKAAVAYQVVADSIPPETETSTGSPPEPGSERVACERALANPARLWPARGAMKAVKIEGVGNPGTYRLRIDRVRSDEPVRNKAGRDRTGPDAIVGKVKPTRAKPNPVDRLWLRAERQFDSTNPLAPGNGRVYTVDFTLTDAEGECAGVVKVGVPVAPAGPLPLDDGPSYDATKRR